jgi:hypothetical protein
VWQAELQLLCPERKCEAAAAAARDGLERAKALLLVIFALSGMPRCQGLGAGPEGCPDNRGRRCGTRPSNRNPDQQTCVCVHGPVGALVISVLLGVIMLLPALPPQASQVPCCPHDSARDGNRWPFLLTHPTPHTLPLRLPAPMQHQLVLLLVSLFCAAVVVAGSEAEGRELGAQSCPLAPNRRLAPRATSNLHGACRQHSPVCRSQPVVPDHERHELGAMSSAAKALVFVERHGFAHL